MLGEQEVIDLRISREVISDVERFIRGRNPALLPKVAEIIDKGRMAITSEPNEDTIVLCKALTGYRPDARILAAAIECAADVLVTFDSTRLLGNPQHQAPGSRRHGDECEGLPGVVFRTVAERAIVARPFRAGLHAFCFLSSL